MTAASPAGKGEKRRFGEVPARVLAAELDLAGAWERVRQKAGMPGADGISVSRFARAHKALLKALQTRLASDCYRALPLRLAEVPKKSGAARLLLVPAVVDRVAQSAVASWLSGRWNVEFDASSFAYRPGLGVADALRALAALRDRDYRWVLDADIRNCFDSIDHALLLAKVVAWLGASSPLAGWIRQWVEAAIWDGAEVTRLSKGVPQGSPLSPLLANYYLDTFDRDLRAAGAQFIRYADDFVVLARTPFELPELRSLVEQTLGRLHLELNQEKTRTTSFGPGFRFLGAEIQGGSILLPFEKPKAPRRALWVSPPMPAALQRAYRAGHLAGEKAFVWKAHSEAAGRSPGVTASNPLAAVSQRAAHLGLLAGGRRSSALECLRRPT